MKVATRDIIGDVFMVLAVVLAVDILLLLCR